MYIYKYQDKNVSSFIIKVGSYTYCMYSQAFEFLSNFKIIIILFREGRYHHLHTDKFINRNSEACDVFYNSKKNSIN